MRYLIFLGLVIFTVGGSHFYFWTRLVKDTGLPAPWRLAATFLLFFLALSLPASFFLTRLLGPQIGRLILFPLYFWMGLMLLLLSFFFVTDLLRWSYQLVAWIAGQPADRLWLGRLQALLVGGAALVLGVISVPGALGTPRVRRLDLPLPGLPAALDGTRVAQITDLHLGPTLGRPWLERVVGQVNELRPDLVAITGDLVDGSVAELRATVDPLARLRTRHGVYFVTGNHEYYAGALEWMEELPRLGLRVLRNERIRIGGASGFDLAGVDDASAARAGVPGHGEDLARALAGRDGDRALLLLAHQPVTVKRAARLGGVGLQLSGHTHGGQIWPWTYLVRLQQPAVRGLSRFGQTSLYVSDGTGFWGPPMRLGTRAEITLITLRSAPLR